MQKDDNTYSLFLTQTRPNTLLKCMFLSECLTNISIQHLVQDQQTATVRDDRVTVPKANTLHLFVSVMSSFQTLVLIVPFGLQSLSHLSPAAPAIFT